MLSMVSRVELPPLILSLFLDIATSAQRVDQPAARGASTTQPVTFLVSLQSNVTNARH